MKRSFVLFFAVCIVLSAQARLVVDTLSSSGTWTVPPGVTSCTIYLWGGGGGGGAMIHNYAINNANTGGGGGGACGVAVITGLTPGSVYTTTVGQGGIGGNSNFGYPGGTGGTSSFSGTLGTWSVLGGLGGSSIDGCPGCVAHGGAGSNSGSGAGMTIYAGGHGSAGYDASLVDGAGGGAGGSGGAGDSAADLSCGVAAAGGIGVYAGGAGAFNPSCGIPILAGGVNGNMPGGGASGINGYAPNQYPRLDGAIGGSGQIIIVYQAPGSALSFDGLGEYVSINNTGVGNFGTGDFTVEFDMNTTTGAQNGYIIAKRSFCGHSNFWNLYSNAGGTISVEFDQDAAATNYTVMAGSTTVNDGAWHHVALSRLSGVASLYIDGILDFTTPLLTSINNTQPMWIGSSVCAGQNNVGQYSGRLDELRIWSVSRTQAQIQASMACEVSAQPGLVAAYHFDQGSAGATNTGITTLSDSSRHGYNGTLHNFALSGTTSNWVSPGSITNGNACPPVNYWTGVSSTNWNDAGNWSVAIPTSTTDALIAGGYSRYPNSLSSFTLVQNVTIWPGGSLSIPAGVYLQVFGDWINNGTASVGNGYVYVPTGANTTFYGYTSFGGLTVAGQTNVGPATADHIDIRGILELDPSGQLLTIAGKVTLKSTATQTAAIVANGGNLTGEVTMERYISGAVGNQQISSPVSNATVSSWSTSFPITGVSTIQSNVPGQEGTLEQYAEYSNATTSLNNGYYNYTASGNPLTIGAGYTARLFTLPITLKTFGTPTTGTVSIPVTASAPNPTVRGWNLVGNPYPSSISWTAVKAGNSGTIFGTCYIWLPTGTGANTGSWQAYNGTAGTNGVGNVIASSQGFLIKTTAGTTLSFTDAMRTTDLTTTFYKAPALLDNEVRIAISSTTDAGSEAVAYTAAGATEGTDIDLDGISPPLPDGIESPSVAFAIGGESYLIHATDAITESTIMPLTIHTGTAGTYYINATSLNVANLPVYLYDNVANTYTDLSTGTVTLTTQGSQDITGRYSVVFSKKANAMLTDNSVNIYARTGAIAIERSADGSPAAITVTNLLGQQVVNTTTTNSTITLPIATTDAIYIVSVRQNGNATVKKVMVK